MNSKLKKEIEELRDNINAMRVDTNRNNFMIELLKRELHAIRYPHGTIEKTWYPITGERKYYYVSDQMEKTLLTNTKEKVERFEITIDKLNTKVKLIFSDHAKTFLISGTNVIEIESTDDKYWNYAGTFE